MKTPSVKATQSAAPPAYDAEENINIVQNDRIAKAVHAKPAEIIKEYGLFRIYEQ